MRYVNDTESIQQQTDMIGKIHQALVKSKGVLRLELNDGRTVQGHFWGIQCSANNRAYVHCNVSLGDEEDEYPGIYDVTSVRSVYPIA
jgi:5-carboxymethyl-2-hydroxymuconate isomerase